MNYVLKDATAERVRLVQGGDSLDNWRREIDSYYAQMKEFVIADPAEIFTCIAGMTARASEIRTKVVRTENRVLQNFRTKELDPFIMECDRQFKVWSRAFTVYQTEAEQAGRL